MSNFPWKGTTLGLLTGLLCLIFIPQGFSQDSHLAIAIKLEKEIFIVSEPIDGEILINSTIPTTYSVNFRVEIYKDELLQTDIFTRAPVFLGETKYQLKNFGIPTINTGEESQGHWRIVISSQGNPSVTAEAKFVIQVQEK